MDVELLAVNTVNNAIARSSRLKAYITTNDKTPFTDGHIDIYDKPELTKENFAGRVPVQVKGRQRRSKKPLTKFAIRRADLEAFRKDRGLLYFVVTIDPSSGNERAYYALLSPFKLQKVLDRSPKKDLLDISVKVLPTDLGTLERILQLALRAQKQDVDFGFSPSLLERAEHLVLHALTELNLDEPLILDPEQSDFTAVLHTTDGLSVPLGGVLAFEPRAYQGEVRDVLTRSGAIEYDRAFVRQVDASRFEVTLDEALTITFSADEQTQAAQDVELKLVSNFSTRLKSVAFFLSLADTHTFEAAGIPIPFEVTDGSDIEWLRGHLKTLQRMNTLFETLHVDTSLIELDELRADELDQLAKIYRGLINATTFQQAIEKPTFVVQTVGPWHLLLQLRRRDDDGLWHIDNPFAHDLLTQPYWLDAGGDSDVLEPGTVYDVLQEEYLKTTLNLRLDSIVEAYEAQSEFESIFELANLRVLALIDASDHCEGRRDELLTAARDLNSWLRTKQGDLPQHLINEWQIARRTRELLPHERASIRELRRTILRGELDEPDPETWEFACALLLDEKEAADELLAQLSKAQIAQLRRWPIWALRGAGGDATQEPPPTSSS